MEEEKKKNNKRKFLIIGIAVAILAITTTFAYFVASLSTPAVTDVDVSTETTEKLIFTPGTPINLVANIGNFPEAGDSLESTTSSTAQILASSGSGNASATYNVYFNINTNDFEYVVDADNPELLLQVIDPNGDEVTNLDGVQRKTIVDSGGNTITGYDITTKNCLLKIAENYAISTTDSVVGTTQEWTIKVIFVNLDTDQTLNEGKTFDAELILQQEKMTNSSGSVLAKDALLINDGGKAAVDARSIDLTYDGQYDSGLYSFEDNLGSAYFFRGAVDNNWVNFAGFYWRIVRINGDGSIRMIYSGTDAPTEAQKVHGVAVDYIDSVSYNADESGFHTNWYMYEEGNLNGRTTDSIIKGTIDTWFVNNLVDYQTYLADSGFCDDRDYYTDGTTEYGYNDINVYSGSDFAPGFYTLNYPVLRHGDLHQYADNFSCSSYYKTSNVLTYPIGLISAGDVYLAGFNGAGEFGTIESGVHYLRSEEGYWTSTAITNDGNGNSENVLVGVSSSGDEMEFLNINQSVDASVRPVINLKSDTAFEGTGIWNDPYVIGENLEVCTI